jgi:hypothetical protein
MPYFQCLAPYVTGQYTSTDEVSGDFDTLDVDDAWQAVKTYSELRSSLWDEGLRGTELAQQLDDKKPSRDTATVMFVGDYNMKAVYPMRKPGTIGTYNQIVARWQQTRERFSAILCQFLLMYSKPFPSKSSADSKDWIFKNENSSQLLNPHQGKGQNETKANSLRMDNVPGSSWIEEHLKVIGLWQTMMPRKIVDVNDWKIYAIAPRNISFHSQRSVLDRFNAYLWSERRRDASSLKSDITSVLLFARSWLDHVELTLGDEDAFDQGITPEQVVSGFYVAQFKLLSQNAYTMVNLSFLNLPVWSGQINGRSDVVAIQSTIDEHLSVVRAIDETHSDGFDLLRRYRDFVSTNNWGSFFDFAAGYSHDIMRRLNADERFVPTFSTGNLRRLHMNTRKDLLPIIDNAGFQNVAYAIRYSTIVPQTLKAQEKEALYDVRYGLGADLKRKGTVRDEFVTALADFMQSYNQENVQKFDNKGQQMRKDLRTTDLQAIVELIDTYGSEIVANLLVAYGYSREPRES